jgi:hypothetical protein
VSNAPTATIDAGGGNGVAVSVPVGSPTSITATYRASAGDTLTASAINDTSGVTSVPCANVTPYNASCWTQPDTTKTYSFTPSASGTYTFYAAIKTANYNTYNNYANVRVTAYVPCANGSGVNGSCTACNAGYTLQGGYCVRPSGSITGQLTANPARVKNGGSTTLTWSTSGMTSCTLKDETGTTLSTLTSSAGFTATNITTKKTYTLSCTDGSTTYLSTASVNVVPSIKEI